MARECQATDLSCICKIFFIYAQNGQYGAYGVSAIMCYINRRFTYYLLTYLLTYALRVHSHNCLLHWTTCRLLSAAPAAKAPTNKFGRWCNFVEHHLQTAHVSELSHRRWLI